MSDCNYRSTDRTGLYLMVFIILMCVLGLKNTDTTAIESRLSRIEDKIELVCTKPNDKLELTQETIEGTLGTWDSQETY